MPYRSHVGSTKYGYTMSATPRDMARQPATFFPYMKAPMPITPKASEPKRFPGEGIASAERLLEVAGQVLHVLDADGQAHQVRRAGPVRPLDARAMLREALHAAEGSRALEDSEPRGERLGRRLPALH